MTRTATLLLLLALLAATPLLAKAEAPAPPVDEETLGLNTDDDLASHGPVETTSQEVTELVTSETMELAPIIDKPRPLSCEEAIQDDLGLRKMNRFQSEWAVFWRLAGFNPTSNVPNSSSLMSNAGLRYKLPDKNEVYYELAYEAGYSFWSGGSADIGMTELAVTVYAAGSPALRLEHHPYYGLGLGQASVDVKGQGKFHESVFTVFGGVEFPARRCDYDVFVKYIYGPDARYNLDDLQIGLGVVYTFGHGR
ncbi:MAG: hypothetical protein HY814_13940 [Candidatus Riflebacteria bacterium]|nr:hypothetical protein [Candidatus Riflebacteria bacterium]